MVVLSCWQSVQFDQRRLRTQDEGGDEEEGA
jgi:hypothetical protein